jgi:hypothetical protein
MKVDFGELSVTAMKDIKLYIDKLNSDAEHCVTISETATNEAKRVAFSNLAGTYRKLAQDLQRILEDHAETDAQRDGHLLGLLSGEDDQKARSKNRND